MLSLCTGRTTLRGWVTPMTPFCAKPASSKIWEICVVLPEPVSPITTVMLLSLTDWTICSAYRLMGSSIFEESYTSLVLVATIKSVWEFLGTFPPARWQSRKNERQPWPTPVHDF